MRILVLGPLELRPGAGTIQLGGPKQRQVLALLLARGDTVVPVSDIVDELWGDDPPLSAEPNVRLYANNLRRLLATWPDAPVLVRRGRGYQLVGAKVDLDLRRFRGLVTNGRDALRSGDYQLAAAQLGEALALWRGPAVADLPCGPVLSGWRDALAEERMSAAENHAEALLGLGDPGRALTEIGEVVAAAPWRERAHALSIRARYRSGDVAGALAAYDTARRHLVEQLGIEPGEELVLLQKAILNRDPALMRSQTSDGSSPSTTAATVPRQLPADVVGFAGRADLLGRQDRLLVELTAQAAHGRPARPGVRVSVITGAAGVGKTAFAVRWAHRAAAEFPDGHLYVNLKGFDRSGPPVAPGAALLGFLEALGVPAARIPADLTARAALFRTTLDGRRVLVVLDNARDVDQVRPLLPGAAGCLTLITSRDRLAGLVAAEGAQPIALNMLTPAEAHELLTVRLGEDRLSAEPDAVQDILAVCGGLPLALAIVAARAAIHPDFTLRTLAVDLRNVPTRLDALALGDPGSDLRDVLSWSYRRLSPAAARLLRLLGSYAGPETTAAAAASLTGVPVAAVRPLLTELSRLHLLDEPTPGRYGFHDLIQAYAVDLAVVEDPPAARVRALRRLLDHYARTARRATELLAPRQETFTLAGPEPGVTAVEIPDAAAAMAWFSTEMNVLLAAIRQADHAGLDGYTFQLAWALVDFCNRRGHWEVLIGSQRLAAEAAHRLGDRSARACSYRYLAVAYAGQSRFEAAIAEARQATMLYAELGDYAGQGRTDLLIADLLQQLGRPRDALRRARRVLGRFQVTGDQGGQARALNSIGWQHALLGQHHQALSHCQRAVALYRQLGDRFGEAHTWDSIGYAHHHLGDHRQALSCYGRALDLFADLGDRAHDAIVRGHLGDAQLAVGDASAARETWRDALEMLTELGVPEADEVRVKLRALDATKSGSR